MTFSAAALRLSSVRDLRPRALRRQRTRPTRPAGRVGQSPPRRALCSVLFSLDCERMLLESAPAFAPAILVVALGAVLAWVLARAFDPVPARVWAVFSLVLA